MNLQFLDIFIESRPSHELLCKNHSHFNGNGYFDNNYIQNLFLNGILTEGVTKMHHISPLMISSGCLKKFGQIEHLASYKKRYELSFNFIQREKKDYTPKIK